MKSFMVRYRYIYIYIDVDSAGFRKKVLPIFMVSFTKLSVTYCIASDCVTIELESIR
jgi:hypothetical protein